MSVLRGPNRMVLIRSGGYDYAELQLHAPVHLVADNNVGKTTLIAALQFLYIDDPQKMHFSHSWSETRQHYFPETHSLMLFEVWTPTGPQVVGFRGLGPVQGFRYERLIYAGEYKRTDFIDGLRVLPWKQVSRGLVAKRLRMPLKASELRASLLGSGKGEDPPLGIIPLARATNYGSFRFLFRNLLQLSRIAQGQLKRLFVDISDPQQRRVQVDLRRDYARVYARVQREAASVAALQRVDPMIQMLVDKFDAREAQRRRLVHAWQAIEQGLSALRAETEEAMAKNSGERQDLDSEEHDLDRERDMDQQRLNERHTKVGGLKEQKKQLHGLRERAQAFAGRDFEAQIRSNLTKELDAFAARLHNATGAQRADVESELRRIRRTIDGNRRVIAQFADSVAVWLLSADGLTRGAADNVFRIINPALLQGVIGDGSRGDEIEISDPNRVLATLKEIARAFEDGSFVGPGVRVPQEILGSGSVLADYQDIAALRKRVSAARKREATLSQTLSDIDARELVEEQRSEVAAKLEKARARLRDWRSWQDKQDKLQEINQELEQLSEDTAAIKRDLEARTKRQQEIGRERQKLVDAERAMKNALGNAANAVQQLPLPAPDWPRGDEANELLETVELFVHIDRYRTSWDEQESLSNEVRRLLDKVEAETVARYEMGSEADTVARLADEREALAKRVTVVEKLWGSLVDGLRSDFKALLDALSELERQVSRLNRALAKRQISNLESVKLELVRQAELVDKLQAVVDAEYAPLFAGPDGRSRAERSIAIMDGGPPTDRSHGVVRPPIQSGRPHRPTKAIPISESDRVTGHKHNDQGPGSP